MINQPTDWRTIYKILNKGINAPIAIMIIVVFAVFVGGVYVWQNSEINKEAQKESAGIPEIKIFGKQPKNAL